MNNFSIPSQAESIMDAGKTAMSGFGIIFVLSALFAVAVFVFVILMIFSPKVRGKMMSKQAKAARYMAEESKDDIKYTADAMSEATHDAIRNTVSAVREGIEGDCVYCKHCGKPIDRDSRFCKECGGEQ